MAFRKFEENRKALDEDVCNCSKIKLQERYGEWTVYASDVKDTCSFGASCWTPPAPCPGADHFTLRENITFWQIIELPWKLLNLFLAFW